MAAGRLAMREAVQAFLVEAKLEMVGEVFAARPELIPEQAYEENRFNEAVEGADGSSAVLVIHIPKDKRQRRALSGRGAVNDSWIHDVAIEIFFANTEGNSVKAQEDYDKVVDQIVELIRSNATLKAPASVWSAGEYQAGIDHEQGEPFQDADGTNVLIHGVVMFEGWQWIAGPV